MSDRPATNQTEDEIDDPLPDGSDFRIIIVDECTADWSPTNNLFTKVGNDASWDRTVRLWNGVLIQLGEHRYEKHGPGRIDQLKSVTFERNGVVLPNYTIHPKSTWEDGHLYWINVATKVGGSSDPMAVSDICGLRIDEAGASSNRHFRSYWGGLTLWTRDGWDLKATVNGHRHYQFTFTVKITEHFETKVYEDGQLTHDLSKMVDTIRINNLAGGGHGDQLSPPQYPPVTPP